MFHSLSVGLWVYVPGGLSDNNKMTHVWYLYLNKLTNWPYLLNCVCGSANLSVCWFNDVILKPTTAVNGFSIYGRHVVFV